MIYTTLMGVLIENKKSTPGFPLATFDLSGWESGIYTVRLTSSEGKTTKKLVVD